ncbi:FAS1-like dehydratase domain-containing protein [Ancylobacter mangrovi]|uniref:FAS1-like dehydratase domain-containing protein n=1 Tax=Ancylobacter mangrovi TaxID=2972472 RepID=UPI002162B2F7|nr:MaoC family dehydratase N-terminal domain-containing protein [Ancylobacter mangrovi]MCS0504707.1 MaoC family dehydratase N-terminal domain-containing protein [Ancylobacter mangrovi]
MTGFDGWIGRIETAVAQLDGWPLAGLYAALDQAGTVEIGTALPPTGQWLYFQPLVPQAGLGPDGHPERGGFLPPIELPRRMWAASEITFHRPMCVGDTVEKRSRIAGVSVKNGRTGTLAFVTVNHSYLKGGLLMLTEVQTLVYREAPAPGEPAPPPQPAPGGALWSHRVVPDTRLLFRYSAVTFNAHRIHYDEPYAREVEGYPGLVVHGQLTATLLVDAFRQERPTMAIGGFSFRAMRPVFAGTPVHLEGAEDGKGYALWARDQAGAVVVEAKIRP